MDSITAPARSLRDGQIFEAAYEVAADPGASVEARVYAFRTLMITMYPGLRLGYAHLSRTQQEGGSCIGRGISAHAPSLSTGAPLPPDYGEQIHRLAADVSADPSTLQSIRNAASCAYYIKPAPLIQYPAGDGQQWIITGEDFTLRYVCRNTFQVRSPYTVPMTVQYRLQRSTEQGTLSLPPRAETEAYTEKLFTVSKKGTVDLLQDGELIQSVPNGNTRCP